MNYYILLFVICIISFIIIFIIIFKYNQNNKIESFNSNHTNNIKKMNITYYSNLDRFNRILTYIIKKYNIIKTDKNEWNIYLPSTYKYIEKELEHIKLTNSNQYIFAIKGCDKIVSKNSLWTIISDYYGIRHTSKMLPKSYIISNKKDIEDFKKEYDENNIYLLKKNVQRKEGILLTRDKNEILKIINNTNNNTTHNTSNRKYKLIQLYIQDIYLVNNIKCNLRLY